MRPLLVILLINICSSINAQKLTWPGKLLPSDTASLFVVSDALSNRDFTISPNGDEIFYTIQQRDFSISTILRLYKKNGTWGVPEVASFSGKFNDLEASFSPDGNRIYFSSNRPSSAIDSTNDFDIWYVNRTAAGWSEPVHAGFVINSPGNEFYPSVAKSGNIYFTTEFKNGKGKEDIIMCEWKNGAYFPPVSLPEAINSKGYEFNAFIDPDEQFILFTAYGRADDMGHGDIYMSRKDASGRWLPAKNLGPKVNSTALDYCPYISPDKKIFFFSSNRILNQTPFAQPQSYM
ncbi:MAG TPA: hypothetical protein VEB42_12450, partial [Chitinophagaceae bacterium]|nr:hypothetical protein [Chitinophagaceae bacterium]